MARSEREGDYERVEMGPAWQWICSEFSTFSENLSQRRMGRSDLHLFKGNFCSLMGITRGFLDFNIFRATVHISMRLRNKCDLT